MNGYIVETICAHGDRQSGEEAVRWIGIFESAQNMIALLPGRRPSVVDRGPVVLARARSLGVRDHHFKRLFGE